MSNPEAKMRLRNEALDPALEKAHAKALAFMRDRAINPAHFKGVSAGEDEQIALDQAAVEKTRAKFAAPDRQHKLADVFEALVCDLSSTYTLPGDKYKMPQPGWFGYRGLALKTSDYDDFLNHTDLILEFMGKGADQRRVEIAIDLTFAMNDKVIQEKFATIQHEVYSGAGRRIRYLESPRSGKKRNLTRLPSAVIGVSYETVAGLARLWASTDPKDQQQLHNSPVRRIIAQELLMQMSEQRVELEQEIREHPERAGEFSELLNQYKLAQHFAHEAYTHVSNAKFTGGEDLDPVAKNILAGKKSEQEDGMADLSRELAA